MNAVMIVPVGDVYLISDYITKHIYGKEPFKSYDEAYRYAKDNFLAVVSDDAPEYNPWGRNDRV